MISTTVTLAAVFLPVIFLSGLTGRLFREFGIVVAGSVLISAVVSLTSTPMMSARLLKHKTKQSRFFEVTERFFTRRATAMNVRFRPSSVGDGLPLWSWA